MYEITLLVLRIINAFLLIAMFIMIFANMVWGKVKRSFAKTLMIVNMIWGITFLIANVMEYGFTFKILNLLSVAVVLFSGYEIIFGGRIRKDIDADANKNTDEIHKEYKFYFLWLIGVLLIPVLLILVIKGY